MAWWKRQGAVIDVRREAGPPGATCPTCGGPGSVDYVDLVLQKSLHTCRRCARLWEAPTVPAASTASV